MAGVQSFFRTISFRNEAFLATWTSNLSIKKNIYIYTQEDIYTHMDTEDTYIKRYMYLRYIYIWSLYTKSLV